jgi:outer membrane scaffolding protein for murein synthesis (MipA/OmpV family)
VIKCSHAVWLVCILFSSSVLSDNSYSKEQSTLEIGAGISVVDIPHYAGSEQSKSYAIPFPFFRYKSKNVSLDRDGLKRYLLKGEDWDLDLSFAATIPLDSDESRAREGMPDLDWVGLIGPAFNYNVFKKDDHELKINVPLRFAVSTDLNNFDYVGWDFSPRIQWRTTFKNEQIVWNSVAAFGLEFADAKYHGYFYSVDDEFSTAQRNSYEAKSGYGGFKITLGINRRDGNFWFGAFTRYRNLADAEFVDSPIVTTKENLYVGIAFAWILKTYHFND